MFTGIVERQGTVVRIDELPGGPGAGRQLTILPRSFPGALAWQPVVVGESISTSGICLTVVGPSEEPSGIRFDVVPETLRRTTLGRLRVGEAVNLERSLAVGDRLGGHFLTGHIDGVGEITGRRPMGSQDLFQIQAPRDLIALMIQKGSVAVDGVSLTIVEVNREEAWFSFAAIPHTLAVTTLGARSAGEPVNLEADALGKWVLHGLREILGPDGARGLR